MMTTRRAFSYISIASVVTAPVNWSTLVTFSGTNMFTIRPALTVTGEVIVPRPDQGAQDPVGWYALAQYRFARVWWLGLGAGYMNRDLPHEDHDDGHDTELFAWEEADEYKVNLTWVPSEFSAIRAEVAHYRDRVGDADDTLVSLQVNFTIGSHPAHLY